MKSALLAISLLLPSISFAGPSCIWDLESSEVSLLSSSKLEIKRYDCRNKDYWHPEVIKDVYKAYAINSKHEYITLEDSDNYEAIQLISGVPVNAIYYSYPGSSNVGNSIRIYDENWKHTKTLSNPINDYQANNRKGSEYKIIGFFKIDGKDYIENIRTDCNTEDCRQYVIDTYKVIDGSLVVVNTRDYKIDDYKRFN